MVPAHVLQKMRAALLVAGAASVGCTKSKVAAEVADASDLTEGGSATMDGSYLDASGDAADSAVDDGGAIDGGADAEAFGTIGCPIHGSHLLLADGGLQQSAGIQVGGGFQGHGFECLGCGMGGARANPTPTTDKPQGEAQLGGMSGAPADSDLPRLVAGMRPRIRQCYRKGLESDPTMAGRITVHAIFGPNGECTKVTVTANTGLSPSVEACITASFRRLQANGPAEVTLPISFASQK